MDADTIYGKLLDCVEQEGGFLDGDAKDHLYAAAESIVNHPVTKEEETTDMALDLLLVQRDCETKFAVLTGSLGAAKLATKTIIAELDSRDIEWDYTDVRLELQRRGFIVTASLTYEEFS